MNLRIMALGNQEVAGRISNHLRVWNALTAEKKEVKMDVIGPLVEYTYNGIQGMVYGIGAILVVGVTIPALVGIAIVSKGLSIFWPSISESVGNSICTTMTKLVLPKDVCGITWFLSSSDSVGFMDTRYIQLRSVCGKVPILVFVHDKNQETYIRGLCQTDSFLTVYPITCKSMDEPLLWLVQKSQEDDHWRLET